MLEIHKLRRYEIAPVVIFDKDFDPINDATECIAWLKEFKENRGRLPNILLFTFREPDPSAFDTVTGDKNAENALLFMKHLVGDSEMKSMLSQIRIQLDFVDMSSAVADQTYQRILNRDF